jgi:hypothetical protein
VNSVRPLIGIDGFQSQHVSHDRVDITDAVGTLHIVARLPGDVERLAGIPAPTRSSADNRACRFRVSRRSAAVMSGTRMGVSADSRRCAGGLCQVSSRL